MILEIYLYHIPPSDKFVSHKIKYFDVIIDTNNNLSHLVYSSLTSKSFPFIIGGDHSLALGSIAEQADILII